MGNRNALSGHELKTLYGPFFHSVERRNLDPEEVPEDLQELIPYAEFWGIEDDYDRERLVSKAPDDVLENLYYVVGAAEQRLNDWLAGDDVDTWDPSPEYCAFTTMRMAADFAGSPNFRKRWTA
jgi:hypothetical protein